MPFKTGRSRRLHDDALNCVAKFPLFSGELHCRNSEARVSRLTGKFDTTASAPKWQVAISVLPGHADTTGWLSSGKLAHKCQSATPPWDWRLGTCTGHWPLEQVRWICFHLLQVPSRIALIRARFVAVRLLPGPAFFGPPIFFPGSLLHHWHPLISNRGAVCLS